MRAVLEVQQLCFAYPGQEKLFSGIDFSLRPGEIVGLMGPSGSGKSTLCYCFCGIIPRLYEGELSGNIQLFDREVANMEIAEIVQKIGILFQDPDTQLFSSTVEDDVVFGPENLCWTWPEMDISLRDALSAVRMEENRSTNPKTLSGGQGQLAALGAVLALDPKILIFDEAMSQLDPAGVLAVHEAAVRLKQQGKSVILVEHDPDRLRFVDRRLVLEGGKLTEVCDIRC